MKAQARFPRSLIASALLAAFGPAVAADGDEEMAQLTKPQSEVSVGVGYVNNDNQRFGQYTGLTDEDAYLLFDANIARRDDATGTWLRFTGRNVGFDNRLLRFEHERQGNWGYFIEFNQIPRFDPYTVNTGLQGIGTTTVTPVTIAPGAGANYEFKTDRDRVSVGFRKALARGLGLQVQLSNEEKEGLRRWGQGTFGTWRFLAEPIDQTTRQLDATLTYSTEKLQLSGGYYGTSFVNHNQLLTVGGATLFAGSNLMALPPDNQSHQLHLAGGYSFTQATRATFKLARGTITQDETFPTTPVAGAPGNLDGRIDTTLAEAGLTTRLAPALSLRASVGYENRDDKTPVFRYFPSQNTVGATNDGTNETRDIETTRGKVDATYRLPMAFSLTGGLEYVEKKRNSPPVRSVDFREKTDETSYKAELRRSVAETVTGAVSYVHSVRRGSDWLPNFGNQTTVSTGDLIAPLHLADRDRDLVRLVLNWMPTEPLSLNFRVDAAQDDYASRGFTCVRPRSAQGRGAPLFRGCGVRVLRRRAGDGLGLARRGQVPQCRLPVDRRAEREHVHGERRQPGLGGRPAAHAEFAGPRIARQAGRSDRAGRGPLVLQDDRRNADSGHHPRRGAPGIAGRAHQGGDAQALCEIRPAAQFRPAAAVRV